MFEEIGYEVWDIKYHILKRKRQIRKPNIVKSLSKIYIKEYHFMTENLTYYQAILKEQFAIIIIITESQYIWSVV